MRIKLAERGALLTFCTISCQRATLCSLFEQKVAGGYVSAASKALLLGIISYKTF